MEKNASFISKVKSLYVDGFREMTVGRSLWLIIILKLIIMFAILKVFFFPNILNRDYDNDDDRAAAVRTSLMKSDNNETKSNN